MSDNQAGHVLTEDVSFDLSVYSLDTVKRAAYRLTGKASFEIKVVDGSALCTIRFAGPISPQEARRMADNLRTEVLDQDLRASLAQETMVYRNAVLALAFSRSGLQASE
jgi:His-Xaa-Ser system protein HxsD